MPVPQVKWMPQKHCCVLELHLSLFYVGFSGNILMMLEKSVKERDFFCVVTF